MAALSTTKGLEGSELLGVVVVVAAGDDTDPDMMSKFRGRRRRGIMAPRGISLKRGEEKQHRLTPPVLRLVSEMTCVTYVRTMIVNHSSNG